MIVEVIGTAQDAGYPQIGCNEICCKDAWIDHSLVRYPSCIALINKKNKEYWLFDVTPDIKPQLKALDKHNVKLAGVFITHAHFGHYMGIFNFGLEVMNLTNLPIYVMPRMKEFLKSNSIINQMIINKNIVLKEIHDGGIYMLEDVAVTPFLVPHRNELSETVGFQIKGITKKIIYMPDIDSWNNWNENLLNLVENNDILFIDGTFFSNLELKNRDISKIPHPAIKETIKLLNKLENKEKRKIFFIHFNHTNRAIITNTRESNYILKSGFQISREGQSFDIS